MNQDAVCMGSNVASLPCLPAIYPSSILVRPLGAAAAPARSGIGDRGALTAAYTDDLSYSTCSAAVEPGDPEMENTHVLSTYVPIRMRNLARSGYGIAFWVMRST